MAISRRRLLRRIGAAAAVAASPVPLSAFHVASRPVRGPAPIRLSQNESAYGPSSRVLSVIRDVNAATVALYPDVECEHLRNKLAAAHRVSTDAIAVAAGATEILRTIFDTFTSRDHTVCPVVGRLAAQANTRIVGVPLAHNWSYDFAGMLQRCERSTRLVYFCNPHNPTGSVTRRSAIDAFIRELPPSTYVVVDEAYHHYVSASDYVSFLDRPAGDPRVIVVRTFSKAYGLAGMRVGYAVAHPRVAACIEDRRATPTVGSAAALAASAALDDAEHLRLVVARLADDRQEFYNQANARMLRVIDSHANFVMLNTARRAADIVKHFERNGVALPAPFSPLDEYIRVTIGPSEDMMEFWRVWDLMALPHTA
jgi:histidinol-phosphate aminotransferase